MSLSLGHALVCDSKINLLDRSLYDDDDDDDDGGGGVMLALLLLVRIHHYDYDY